MTLSRRAFLGTAAKLGALTAGATLARREACAATPARTFHLEAREVTWELMPGRTIRGMAYNGVVPGPEIRARQGEHLRVVFTNALPEPTTIHWHGVDVPNAMDGVPGVTQRPVEPGETFVYEFTATPPGTRWYHTHLAEHRQLDLGLAAPLVIEPADGEALRYDREVTFVLDDWATGSGKPLPPTHEGIGGTRGGAGGMMRGMGGMMRGMMESRRTPLYDTMTINGKAYPATPPLALRRGERLRLRLINVSAEHTHVLHLAGHRLAVTHGDGNPLRDPVVVDAIPLAPSERCDAILTADHPGAWWLACLQPGHAGAGERMLVLYAEHAARTPAPPPADLSSLDLWQYGLGRGRDVLPAASGPTRTFDLQLSGGMDGRDLWRSTRRSTPTPTRCASSGGTGRACASST